MLFLSIRVAVHYTGLKNTSVADGDHTVKIFSYLRPCSLLISVGGKRKCAYLELCGCFR